MAKPTQTDAEMLLRLAQLQAHLNLSEAFGYIYSDEFPADFAEFRRKYPRGSRSQEAGLVHRLLGWYETVGTLYRNGLLNEDLLFDWLAITGAWDRVKGFALGLREESGEPRLWENFEHMAGRQESWRPTRP